MVSSTYSRLSIAQVKKVSLFLALAVLWPSLSLAEDLGTAVETAAVPEEIQAELPEAPPAEETQAPTVEETAPVEPEDEGLPAIIISGLDAYTLEGAEAAVKAWIKGGPNESDPNILTIVDTFKEVESRYGLYTGHEVISIKILTPSSKLVYLQMNYEKGPFFCRFLSYRHAGTWVVSGRLAFDTDPQKIMVLDASNH